MSMSDTPSHFFRAVRSSTLKDKKLNLPENFVTKFGNELSAVAVLRVPNGRVWHVGLTKRGNKIWFQDGWHDFVEYHSICAGYFVFFRYEKNSNFHVLIFDITACEILYPRYYGPGDDEQNSVHEDEIRNDDSVEIKGPATPNPPFRSVKKENFDEWPSNGSSNELYVTPSTLDGVKRSFSSALGSPASLESPNFEHAYESCSKKCKVEQFLETHRSKAMNESNQGKLNWNEMYNSQGSFHRRKLMAENAETGSWTTTHSGEDDNPTEVTDELEYLPLLEAKRICVSQRFGVIAAEERERAINVARMLKPKNPSFMIILRQRNITKSFLYMPVEFAHKYLNRDIKVINLQVSEGREWPVQLVWRYWGGPDLTRGWARFLRDNSLKKDDICVFELTRMKDVLLKVSVFHRDN
ncbi:hypothetical protein Ddye_003763 [Dipteronia dyeriana]|uniref:TF-B3 domain-containing protein n=1 Tax=Dipteronia dyeriana TaxID=168575 RepID=A0AAD9XSW6_9ROSI|nr:hypothetical protein Ddye_003763 [Dipteronia dyeriana]